MIPQTISAQVSGGFVGLEREFELDEVGIHSPAGLAYDPQVDVFLFQAGVNGQANQTMVMLDRYERRVGEVALGTAQLNPLATVFNPLTKNLITFDRVNGSLLKSPLDGAVLTPEVVRTDQGNIQVFGSGEISGAAVDNVSGRLFLLNPAGPSLAVVQPDGLGGFAVDRPVRNQIRGLRTLGAGTASGLAFNPTNQHLYTLDTSTQFLIEMTDAGAVLGTYDLSLFGLRNPQGMAVAPSGDPAVDPVVAKLYVTDTGRKSMLEFTFIQPDVIAAPSLNNVFTLVNTIQTSVWTPPSPDPMGIAPLPNGNFLVTDSEVDEMPIFAGVNVFEMTPNGAVVATCTTLAYNNEPAGVAVHPTTHAVFIPDDVENVIDMVNLGGDGVYCTGDDVVTAFDTLGFNSPDPEGLDFGQGDLFIADGTAKQIYRVRPGANGVFDGVPPAGDDVVSGFDTVVLGLGAPEGVAYHPTRNSLFLVSSSNHILIETTLDGALLNRDNLRDISSNQLSGVAVGPSQMSPGQLNVFITDRGVDNMVDPNENDGRIFELSIGDAPAPTPMPTATATSVPPTPQPTATNMPVPTPTEGVPPAVRSIYLPFLTNAAP
jgi:hypothetical protein